MTINSNNQKGFAALEIALLVVIAGIVGGAGWYVLKANKNISKTNEDTLKSSQTTANKKTATKLATGDAKCKPSNVRSDCWTLIKSGKGGFSVRIPDGWTGVNDTAGNWFVAEMAANTIFTEGKRSVIELREIGGGDGTKRLSINQFKKTDKYSFLNDGGKKVGDFKSANVTGTKYYQEYPVTQADGIGPSAGQQSYTYLFTKGDSDTFVTYNRQMSNQYTKSYIPKDEEDILKIVEEMIGTLSIN